MQAPAVQTSHERLDGDRVKLRVEVSESAFKPALEAAYRKWANDIRVPGFRRGKVPRPIIDARVGPDVVREQALRDSLPGFYSDALRAEELEAIAPPDIEVVEFEGGSRLVFEATVDVRPEIAVPDLSSIEVEAPPSEVTDEDVDEQLERLRDRFAELETVYREARRGDYVLIDLSGSRHGEPVEGASAPDFLYEVGSRSGPPSLDQQLEGNRPGAILKFTDVMPEAAGDLGGQEISFTVLLKEVKAKRLPALDAEFAKTVGEFDTLDELRQDLATRLGEVKLGMVEEQIRNRALATLVDASDLQPPEKLVEKEFEHRLAHLEEELQRAGVTLDAYADQIGSTALQLRSDIRKDAARSVKAELLLEEIARQEQFDVTQQDIARQIAVLAAQTGKEGEEVARELAASDRLGALVADIMRAKALDHVVARANVIGRPAVGGTVGEDQLGRGAEQASTPASGASDTEAAVEVDAR